MVKVAISARSRALLEAHALGQRLPPLRPRPDGRYVVDLDDDVAQALERVSTDPDQAIRILCTTGIGRA